MSFLASREAIEQKLGHGYQSVRELEGDAEVPTVAYVSTESIGEAEGAVVDVLIYVGAVATAGIIIASGGTMVAAIAAAAVAGIGGGALGALLGRSIDRTHFKRLEEQLPAAGCSCGYTRGTRRRGGAGASAKFRMHLRARLRHDQIVAPGGEYRRESFRLRDIAI